MSSTITYYFGLALNGNYVYQGINQGGYYGIAKTSISEKVRDNDWKEISEGTAIIEISDLCGDENYIFVLCNKGGVG